MTKNIVPPEMSSRATDPADFLKDMLKLQSDLRTVIYMPKDFYELYQKSLIDRLKKTGISLMVAKPGMLLEEIGNYDRILAYQCPLPEFVPDEQKSPSNGEGKPANKKELFEVKGAPEDSIMTPFPRKTGYQTQLEHRFLQLRDLIRKQEKDEHFLNLARFQQHIRLKLLTVQQKQLDVDRLVKDLQNIDQGYFLILAYFLQQAVDNVLQLVTLGDVMRKYVKVLIIDDLGERCFEKLEELGFRKRFVSIMTQQTYQRTFEEFKVLYQEQFPDKEVTDEDFLTKCTVFDEYEIISFNQWNVKNGTLNVQFRLKKNPELSNKEIRKKNENPVKVAQKVDRLNQDRRKKVKQLKAVELELSTSEAKGGLSEAAYVALNKKRKRMLKNIQIVTEEINEIQKEVDDRPEITLYSRDYLSVFKDRKTVKRILAQKGAAVSDPKKFNATDLHTLVELIHQKKKKSQVVNQLNSQVKMLHTKMTNYANQHPLDPEKNYQQVLGVHSLNKLEMVVLGCGIAKVNRLLATYPGPYFEVRDQKSSIDWGDELLSQVFIHVASKHIALDTSLLNRFFRIRPGDIIGRIEKSPVLPQSEDFNNDKLGLFIINYNSYPYQEIVDCLKKRNQSSRPFVPVLFVDPMDQIETANQKIVLELLLGLKKGNDKDYRFMTPPYRIDSLEDRAILYYILCEIMGIDGATVPSEDEVESFEMGAEEESFSDQSFAIEDTEFADSPAINVDSPESANLVSPVAPVEDETDFPPVPKKKDDRIRVYLSSEKPEEIYTLGSLFSFDDDAAPPTPQKDPNSDPPEDSSAATKTNAQMIPDQDQTQSEEMEEAIQYRHVEKPSSISVPKQKTHPKNPFQF